MFRLWTFAEYKIQRQEKGKIKMKKMIKMVTMVASFLTMLSFVGCGNNNTPEAVALRFAEKIYSEQDFDGAGKLCTKETASLLVMMKGMAMNSSSFKDKKGAKFEVAKCEVNEDSAEVTLKCTKKSGEVEMMKNKDAITLVKRDGEWKVHIKKD